MDTPTLASSGSSPQMRGAQQAAQKAIDKAGIIPADAESTQIARAQDDEWQDHPHGCGEH